MNRFVSMQVKCAGCGAQFGEANHRFVLHDSTNGWTVTATSPDYQLYTVRRFSPNESLHDHDYPVCGEKCLSTLEGQIIAGKKL
jgi:hypothetical protein